MFGVKNIIFFSSIVENDGSMAAATENNRRKLPSPFDDFFLTKTRKWWFDFRMHFDLYLGCYLSYRDLQYLILKVFLIINNFVAYPEAIWLET